MTHAVVQVERPCVDGGVGRDCFVCVIYLCLRFVKERVCRCVYLWILGEAALGTVMTFALNSPGRVSVLSLTSRPGPSVDV